MAGIPPVKKEAPATTTQIHKIRITLSSRNPKALEKGVTQGPGGGGASLRPPKILKRHLAPGGTHPLPDVSLPPILYDPPHK